MVMCSGLFCLKLCLARVQLKIGGLEAHVAAYHAEAGYCWYRCRHVLVLSIECRAHRCPEC